MDHVVLKLTPQHVAYIRQLLGTRPHDEVAPIIAAVQQQVSAQVEAAQKLEAAKAEAVKKAQDDIGKRAAVKPNGNGAEARA